MYPVARKVFGLMLTVGCLAYISYIAVEVDWSPLENVQTSSLLAYVLFGATSYSLICVSTGFAWWQSVVAASGHHWPSRLAIAIHAKAMILKYLPSNVLHMASRHIATAENGVSHTALTMALVVEVAATIFAALLISLWNYPHLTTLVDVAVNILPSFILSEDSLVWIAIGILALGAIGLLISRDRLVLLTIEKPNRFLSVVALQLLFMFSSAMLGFVILQAMNQDLELGFVVGMLTVAWISGHVIPGAGGGLGIRELVLVAGLTPACGIDTALLFAVLWRLVTLLGDVLFSGLGFLMSPTQPPQASKEAD